MRIVAAGIFALTSAGCSFSRPSPRPPEPPRRFGLTVGEVRDESVWGARADSVGVRRSESTSRHFGRIERVGAAPRTGHSREENDATFAVFNDSLVFRSDAPFRYTALLRRDTLAVTSMDKGPSTAATALDADREMLACIFEGPALRVSAGANDGPVEIVDLKERCAGGLYRRLALPATLGAFVLPVPSERDRPGVRWEAVVAHPGFSGLGLSPALRLRYLIVESAAEGEKKLRIEVSCDTTLANVRTVTPAGDPVDIISHRIRIQGLLDPWPGVLLFHTGELSIEEDIRYTRPDLESPVLEKHCRARIRLDPL